MRCRMTCSSATQIHFCSARLLHWRFSRMLRKMVTMRRIVHVKGDVMCTMLLLILFCLLLYARQVRMEYISIDGTFLQFIYYILNWQLQSLFSDCGLLWMGQSCVEVGDPQLYQLQSDPAGNQQGQSGAGKGVSRGIFLFTVNCMLVTTVCFFVSGLLLLSSSPVSHHIF